MVKTFEEFYLPNSDTTINMSLVAYIDWNRIDPDVKDTNVKVHIIHFLGGETLIVRNSKDRKFLEIYHNTKLFSNPPNNLENRDYMNYNYGDNI